MGSRISHAKLRNLFDEMYGKKVCKGTFWQSGCIILITCEKAYFRPKKGSAFSPAQIAIWVRF